MSPLPPPSAVLSSHLDASPARVWARVCDSGFIAGYLGASLPPADLATRPLDAPPLQGRSPNGQPLDLRIHSRLAPTSLSLQLRTASETTVLHLSISADAQGSRLTLLHQPLHPALAGPQAPPEPALALPAADLAQALARPLPAVLLAGPPADAAARQAALAYLADTARLVAQLRSAMGPRQGYAQPADGGFSLVQHLWHLADVEAHGWSQRFTRLRSEAHPVLPGVDGDRLAVEGRYQQRPWRGAAARFLRLRQRSLADLRQCDLAVLGRPVQFGGQPATGAEVLAAMLAHDHEHRCEMAALWPAAAR